MRFAHPEWLLALWLIPLLWGITWWRARGARGRIEKAVGNRMAPLLTRNVSHARRRWKVIFRTLALFCAVIALARPQLGKGLSEVKVRGVELMVAIDVSTSMLAEDVKPSRLQFAKAELARLFDLLSGDKVGMVGFAGSAVLLSPLTNDISSLKMFLDSLSPDSVETQGTDIQRALKEAAEAFDRGGTEDDEKLKTTRVILVLSDGEDQEPGALDLAKKLAAQGVRIFTIAFGTERGGMIPLRDERGYLRGYKKDRSNREVMSQVKGDFLKDLAKVGQGSFTFATFGGNEVAKVKAEIDKLQKAEFASSLATQYEERFQIFLILALFFALLDLLVLDRAAAERVWKGRFEAGLRVLLPFLLISFFVAESVQASELDGVRLNNRAVQDLKEERPAEALDGFSKSLSRLPNRAEPHFNLGTAFMLNKEPEKALSEYDMTLKANPSEETAFKAHFNRAVIYTEMKKKAEALDVYQKALSIKPYSKEVKTNIELLTAQSDGDGEDESEDSKDQQGQDKKDKPKEGQGKDQKDQKDQKPEQKPNTGPTPKPTPRPFQSEQLSKQDVGRILEEIKRQEDQIRERVQREGGKDAPREKDW